MKITENLAIGYDSGVTGFETFHHSTTDTTCAEFVVIGFRKVKSLSTTSSPVLQRTCLTLIIFNQHMDIATIERAQDAGSQ